MKEKIVVNQGKPDIYDMVFRQIMGFCHLAVNFGGEFTCEGNYSLLEFDLMIKLSGYSKLLKRYEVPNGIVYRSACGGRIEKAQCEADYA